MFLSKQIKDLFIPFKYPRNTFTYDKNLCEFCTFTLPNFHTKKNNKKVAQQPVCGYVQMMTSDFQKSHEASFLSAGCIDISGCF